MLRTAVNYSSTTDANELRSIMAGPPSTFVPSQHIQKKWEDFRRLQVRQLFRLSLEALFFWALGNLEQPKGIEALVEDFLKALPQIGENRKAHQWLQAILPQESGPAELINRIETAIHGTSAAGDLAPSIAAGLSFCLSEPPSTGIRFERHDRLPINRAQIEANARKDDPVEDFLQHIFESWVLAQHVYWSVGRGLSDARSGGKSLLRLKVLLDEGGWALTPGASRKMPRPSGDRLYTALTLAQEGNFIG
jgi:hypothetical protein